MLPSFSGCKVQIISGRLPEHSEPWGGGLEGDNKATGEGRDAEEIVLGIAECWVQGLEEEGESGVGFFLNCKNFRWLA